MTHLVSFTTPEGKQAHHTANTLEDAVRFVEHLRNSGQADDDQIETVRIHQLREIPFEFRPYFKVEVGARPSRKSAEGAEGDPPADAVDRATEARAAEAKASSDSGTSQAPDEPEPSDVAQGDDPDDLVADDGGSNRRSLFGRDLVKG